jgi:hypothetical protein
MPKHLTVADTSTFVTDAQVGVANGIAELGADGLVPDSQLPASATGAVLSVNGQVGNVALTAANVDAVANIDKGAANGVAQLDSSSHLPVAQLPASVVLASSVGAPSGIATLDNLGKLSPSQVPTASVVSVNGHTGAVSLNAADVGALDTTVRGAASGVAALDSGSKVPVAQIPSLIGQYQPTPGATPTKAGQMLTAVSSGSNTTQWTEPLTYTAASSGGMPSGVPSGSLCTRTDVRALYEYVSGSWVLLPYAEPWRTLPLHAGIRGYLNNNAEWLPKIRRIGSQVFVRGRVELTAGGNFAASQSTPVMTLPSDCIPSSGADLVGTSTSSVGQIGLARFQANSPSDPTNPGMIILITGSGPNPASGWVGIQGSFWLD